MKGLPRSWSRSAGWSLDVDDEEVRIWDVDDEEVLDCGLGIGWLRRVSADSCIDGVARSVS